MYISVYVPIIHNIIGRGSSWFISFSVSETRTRRIRIESKCDVRTELWNRPEANRGHRLHSEKSKLHHLSQVDVSMINDFFKTIRFMWDIIEIYANPKKIPTWIISFSSHNKLNQINLSAYLVELVFYNEKKCLQILQFFGAGGGGCLVSCIKFTLKGYRWKQPSPLK